ncbi:MAG: flagellar basal body rod protein FlgB [Deltaproteobacteria bacterium]|nr:flagellar basal body rod protein FlgB [Deltaproteobacteria bacterium]
MRVFIDNFLDRTLPGLTKMLDLTWRRGEAISSNIANAETPGYRAVDLNFAGELNRAFESKRSALIARTDSKHLDVTDNGNAHLIADLSGATKPDGNNVDIDIQMGRLTYNSGKYSAAANVIRKQMSLLKNAIRDSR